MKQREPRRKVMIRARMRCGASWQDACILNLSSRGLMLQAPQPPPRGSYVEIGRGRHVIVARVAWVKHHRAGLRAQEKLPVDALIAEPGEGGAAAPTAAPTPAERRKVPRVASRHEHNRWRARAIEFLCIGLLGLAGCVLAFGAVEQSLARPIHAVEEALAAR